MGNEEESMLLLGAPGMPYDTFHDPFHFVNSFPTYIPSAIKSHETGGKHHLQNGAMFYDGGGIDTEGHYFSGVNLERTTAETDSPNDLSAAIQANEQLYVDMLGRYVTARRRAGQERTVARAQRRVVDSYGNTRACHDNFELRTPQLATRLGVDKSVRAVLMAHLATRSFMTGAGYVTDGGVYFGQKAEHVTGLDTYGYLDSAYRLAVGAFDADTGPRLEIRCSDINISPWAQQLRLGSAALYITMMQTPLLEQLRAGLPAVLSEERTMLTNMQRFNRVSLDADGRLRANKDALHAADYQERVLTLAGTLLPNFVELTPEYEHIIDEGIQYSQDFKRVSYGEADWDLLADRSDNAAKFMKISRGLRQDRAIGLERTPTDIIAQAQDLHYDAIDIRPHPDKNEARVSYGYGYKLRDHKRFKSTLKANQVEQRYYRPPATTRAAIRGFLIRQGMLENCEWSHVTLHTPDGRFEDLDGLTVPLSDVVLHDPVAAKDPMAYIRSLVDGQVPAKAKGAGGAIDASAMS